MKDIIKIVKPLENLAVLIDGVTDRVKNEIKKQEGGFLGALLGPLAASLVEKLISSVVKGISGRGVRRAGRGYMNKNFQFHSIVQTISRLLIFSTMNLDLMAFVQETI